MKNKRFSKNEFRFNYDTKHTNYVFEEDCRTYHAIGLTHHSSTFGKKNMPLINNPKKGKEEKAYVRNGIITSKKSSFSKNPDKRFKFEKEDFKKVKSKIRNYKSRRRYK